MVQAHRWDNNIAGRGGTITDLFCRDTAQAVGVKESHGIMHAHDGTSDHVEYVHFAGNGRATMPGKGRPGFINERWYLKLPEKFLYRKTRSP